LGDLPSAYLVLDGSPTPMKALETYVELMQEWVDAVKQGKSTNKLIPVEVEQTMENADLLERRLIFLRKKVLP
jgi:phosphosulfolactate synthase (CoM biosynthesis protein A)